MKENLERTLFIGMLETFVNTMNGLTLGFRQDREQTTAEETCITAKLDSGDVIWLWFRPDDPSKIQLTSVPFGSDYSRFGIHLKGDRAEVGFFGRGTHIPASAIPTAVALLKRWRDLAIAAQGQALIVFPTR
ncbi:hypothetical protein OIU34_24620 [Pararhizobium sp. BT-229]|uniref:hypothetical protein n=1 Tax=Pararhizobium sp. BT-229 TaxID=2986923 RepID=UPI0021F795E6|nr:hypothetical protein [Pararhizobium sp. BT-229]MCV9965086.1 hypothetical protein [Pararhizobium sp. BT-229]